MQAQFDPEYLDAMEKQGKKLSKKIAEMKNFVPFNKKLMDEALNHPAVVSVNVKKSTTRRYRNY